MLYILRRLAVAILQLVADISKHCLGACACNALIHAQPLVLFADVALVNAQRDAEVDRNLHSLIAAFAIELADSLFKHLGVELEADGLDVARLLAAKHVAGAAQFEIERGNLEACAEVGKLFERGEPAARDLRELLLGRNQQIGVSAAVRAAHAAAKLIELAEAVPISAVDDDCVRTRNVEAVLNDARRAKNVVFAVHKGEHCTLKLHLRHLAMADDDARLGHKLTNLRRHFIDALNAVGDEVRLAAALEFDLNGRADEFFVELGDDGLDRHSIFGRRFDHAHVAQTDERHVQCARDGGRRHREHVDRGAHLLQALLVANAKALLLVDNEQAKVLELEPLREDGVRADDDVDLAVCDALENLLALLRRAEAREHLDGDGEVCEAALEALKVLEAENRRRG